MNIFDVHTKSEAVALDGTHYADVVEPAHAKRQRGFTLIELLVVCAIIGLLSAVAVANYRRSIVKAKEAVLASGPLHDAHADQPVLRRQGEVPFGHHVAWSRITTSRPFPRTRSRTARKRG